MTVEWNARKAATNLKNHRLAFEEATTVFLDPLALTFSDLDHSEEEIREITVGCRMKVVFVCHCDHEGRIGIISARHATGHERKQYEDGIDIEEE